MAGEKIKIQLLAESGTLSELTALCAPLGIEHCTESPLALVQTETHLALRKLDEPKLGDVFVDFVAGAMAHRRKFGGGRGEAIDQAVGIKGAELRSYFVYFLQSTYPLRELADPKPNPPH